MLDEQIAEERNELIGGSDLPPTGVTRRLVRKWQRVQRKRLVRERKVEDAAMADMPGAKGMRARDRRLRRKWCKKHG